MNFTTIHPERWILVYSLQERFESTFIVQITINGPRHSPMLYRDERIHHQHK